MMMSNKGVRKPDDFENADCKVWVFANGNCGMRLFFVSQRLSYPRFPASFTRALTSTFYLFSLLLHVCPAFHFFFTVVIPSATLSYGNPGGTCVLGL